MASWNLGGQDVRGVDVAGRDLEVVCVQEVSRGDEGWSCLNTDLFHWVLHRGPKQWRAVGIGIANDRLDCIIGKVATSRGVWVLARLSGLGRVVLGTMHCHTGATNAIFQAAVLQFARECPGKWRQYPAWCGTDANEQPGWSEGSVDQGGQLDSGSSNLNVLSEQLLGLGIRAIAPSPSLWTAATHFPRDTRRRGRQIDIAWSRLLMHTPVQIDQQRRHVIGTDHALLFCDVFGGRVCFRWGNDSRPRYMLKDIPAEILVDSNDLKELARKCTGPRRGGAYRDPPEVLSAIQDARWDNTKQKWKRVHRLRRQAKRAWESSRTTAILQGDWMQYRALQREKRRKTGWWGGLLRETSSADLTKQVQRHLEAKLVNEFGQDWDELLQTQIDLIMPRDEFEGFTLLDLREVVHEMKPHSAVGPDGVSVSFLRCAASDDFIAPQLLALVNHIVANLQQPDEWRGNFLALLAKIPVPLAPKDLRPICVSSVFHKMISKLVCRRVLPILRTGSKLSGCGRGRQAADVIGTISRVRDITREWRLPTLLCKLDISGAFDKLDRLKVVEYLQSKLKDKGADHELRYMIAQLATYRLLGQVPGGCTIEVEPNVGIKQGAPESAEIFGLVMNDILTALTEQPGWEKLGRAFADLDIDLVFYQDDIFIVESQLSRLGRKIKVLERCLLKSGLHLATEKTKIVASEFYQGARKVLVGGSTFCIAPHSESVKVLGLSFCLQDKGSQQARELLGHTRDAAMSHKDLLKGRSSWAKKADMIRTLIETQFQWTAGAIQWSPEDLRQANILQIHILRMAFGVHRIRDERWHEWNARSMRQCRAWLACSGRPRWSTTILTLQHTLAGHWARRGELIEASNLKMPCLPMRALLWRNTAWWRHQQSLSPNVGARHPKAFFASNLERRLADTHGVRWFDLASDRLKWSQERQAFLLLWDAKWCQGRQLAIEG
eukprot:s5075_g3.t1